MPSTSQHQVNATAPIHALADIISPLRLGTYLNAAGHDADRALNLYLWNAKIGEAFHLPIQAVEVGLRNRVSDGLAAAFGADWWASEAFLDVAEERRRDDIQVVLKRLRSQNKKQSTGQVVAGLSFGFWVAMLHKRYNPAIWSSNLAAAFPHLPKEIGRDQLHAEARETADFRNRLWHHEPIFKRNLSADHARCMKLVKWLCPTKASWIRPHCRVPGVLREKP